jgi:pimeloyl-ACP methyl ester carboxylesterase
MNPEPMRLNYSQVIAAIQRENQNQQDRGSLRNHQCHARFLFHAQPTSKVVLLFHGFTAGPYQWARIDQELFQAGYNVLVPLLPGHGLEGSWDWNSPPPLPLHPSIYQDFALRWLKRSRVFGQQIIVGGLGAGATLAAWLSLTYPQQVDRCLLLAPYWQDSNSVVDLFIRNPSQHQSRDHLSRDASSRKHSSRDYCMWVLPQTVPALFGYGGFASQALQPWLELAEDLLEQAMLQKAPPLLLVTSESDRALNCSSISFFLHQVRQTQSQAWHLSFNRVLDLGYALMTQARGNHYESQLVRLIKQYVKLALDMPQAKPGTCRIMVRVPHQEEVGNSPGVTDSSSN